MRRALIMLVVLLLGNGCVTFRQYEAAGVRVINSPEKDHGLELLASEYTEFWTLKPLIAGGPEIEVQTWKSRQSGYAVTSLTGWLDPWEYIYLPVSLALDAIGGIFSGPWALCESWLSKDDGDFPLEQPRPLTEGQRLPHPPIGPATLTAGTGSRAWPLTVSGNEPWRPGGGSGPSQKPLRHGQTIVYGGVAYLAPDKLAVFLGAALRRAIAKGSRTVTLTLTMNAPPKRRFKLVRDLVEAAELYVRALPPVDADSDLIKTLIAACPEHSVPLEALQEQLEKKRRDWQKLLSSSDY